MGFARTGTVPSDRQIFLSGFACWLGFCSSDLGGAGWIFFCCTGAGLGTVWNSSSGRQVCQLVQARPGFFVRAACLPCPGFPQAFVQTASWKLSAPKLAVQALSILICSWPIWFDRNLFAVLIWFWFWFWFEFSRTLIAILIICNLYAFWFDIIILIICNLIYAVLLIRAVQLLPYCCQLYRCSRAVAVWAELCCP